MCKKKCSYIEKVEIQNLKGVKQVIPKKNHINYEISFAKKLYQNTNNQRYIIRYY